MPDGDNLRIGRNNTGNATTRLDRNGGATNTAFDVINHNGDGIRGEASVFIRPPLFEDGRTAEPPRGEAPPHEVIVLKRGTGVVGTGYTGVEGSGSEIGVSGSAPQGVGVYGTSSTGYGLLGSASQGIGVLGASNSQAGVRGESNSSSGVFGRSNAPSSTPAGQLPQSAGVRGESANEAGVFGRSDGSYGVVGYSRDRIGVWGYSASTHPEMPAIHGISENTFGVVGEAAAASKFGVFGRNNHSSGGFGVTGRARSDTGVLGSSNNHVGVRGETATGWGGIFSGPGNTLVGGALAVVGDFVQGRGVKSAAVPHPDGSHRLLYCMESPESWFEDFGSAEMTEGRARVELDGDFAAVVRTEEYHVFLTPEGDSNGLYVSGKDPAGFEVREQQGGTSSLRFSYRVVAKRQDVEARRLARVELPERVDVDELMLDRDLPGQHQVPQEDTSLSE
jgi:hypothetical protein